MFEIASGGMGTVSLALRRESSFERLYAVKRLRPHVAEDTDVREMFVAEAKIAGLIHHPNVVSVLDVGDDKDGPFMAMEWIEGVSLGHLIAASRGADELVPVGLCLDIVAQVARGLHAAHELETHRGEPMALVHRDVSPQNILVGFDGVVKVTDFGISKVLGMGNNTAHGILKGKMGYVSPEQLRFDVLDRRSDLFSLGVVLYEALAGRRLYSSKGNAPENIARRILKEDPPAIGDLRRDVPPRVEELLLEMLAKDRGHRPSTAAEVADRLDAIRIDEMDSDQGEASLGSYVKRLFADRQQETKSRIAEALERPLTPRAQPDRFRIVAALVIACGAALGGWIAWWVTGAPTPTLEATPAVPAAPDVEAAPEAELGAAPAPATEEVTEPEESEAMQASERRGRRARRRRRTQPAAAPMGSRAIPLAGEDGWNAKTRR